MSYKIQTNRDEGRSKPSVQNKISFVPQNQIKHSLAVASPIGLRTQIPSLFRYWVDFLAVQWHNRKNDRLLYLCNEIIVEKQNEKEKGNYKESLESVL